MKKIITVLILMLSVLDVPAQQRVEKGFSFSAGVVVAIPADNLPLWPAGVGADLLTQYDISNLAITADAGFTTLFSRKDINHYNIIPVRIGIRYFPVNKIYMAAKTGVGFLKVKAINDATALAYSFGAGYIIHKKIDIGITYDGYSKNGTIGLVAFRAAYFFNND